MSNMKFKYGKNPFIKDERDLKYAKYRLAEALPPIPATFGHEGQVTEWGMLGNDQVGDCVIAGSDHETMLFTEEGSTEAPFTTETALNDYSAITGYNPDDPNSDQGTDVRTALNYRLNTGMLDANNNRHKIGAFLALDQTNINEVLEAAYLYSAVGIGIQVPDSAQKQFQDGEPWTVVEGATIEGGHYVPIVGFDGTYFYVVTWGAVQKMDVNFFNTYCDETWLILSPEFLNAQGDSPEGFDLAQLQSDMSEIVNPTPNPNPNPNPAPPNPTPNNNSVVVLLEKAYNFLKNPDPADIHEAKSLIKTVIGKLDS